MTDHTATGLAVIDGREALGAVIVRPQDPDNPTNGEVVLEAWANGITHAYMAAVLRHAADQFDQHQEETA